jgi:hypothetical protein
MVYVCILTHELWSVIRIRVIDVAVHIPVIISSCDHKGIVVKLAVM